MGFLACAPRRPHYHPDEHSKAELQMNRWLWYKNQETGCYEFWYKLRERSYTRSVSSLCRLLERENLRRTKKKCAKRHEAKPYEAMQYPGQRVQIDVKRVPTYYNRDKGSKNYD